jgi:enamine deaminase RidA (YjgF/YER057c/UK114 family)
MNMTSIEPEGWLRPRGYSNGILAQGRILCVAGQIGWNEHNQLVSRDFLEQSAQTLRNVLSVVRAAGGEAANIARLTWYVTDKHEYRDAQHELGNIYRELFGGYYPAMTLVQVADLLEDGAKVEIEATAILPF